MKKTILYLLLTLPVIALASTDHYILRQGNHVHHLKITKHGDKVKVTADVDFEPNADEKDKLACASEITGEADVTGENTLTLKKHADVEASFCTLNIELTANGAKIDQPQDCHNFVTGICHFGTEGKEMTKIK
jgi:hypothetical protein